MALSVRKSDEPQDHHLGTAAKRAIFLLCVCGYPLHVLLSKNPFRQAILVARQRQFRRGICLQVNRIRWQKANRLLTAASVCTLDIGTSSELINSCAKLWRSERVMR